MTLSKGAFEIQIKAHKTGLWSSLNSTQALGLVVRGPGGRDACPHRGQGGKVPIEGGCIINIFALK